MENTHSTPTVPQAQPQAKGQIVTQQELRVNPHHKIEIPAGDFLDLVNPLFKRYPEGIVRRMSVFYQSPEKLPADAVAMIDQDMQQKYTPQTVEFMLRQYDIVAGLGQEIAQEQEIASKQEADKAATVAPPANRAQRRKAEKPAGNNKKTATGKKPAAGKKETPIVPLTSGEVGA